LDHRASELASAVIGQEAVEDADRFSNSPFVHWFRSVVNAWFSKEYSMFSMKVIVFSELSLIF
jgi:hypothetical protein